MSSGNKTSAGRLRRGTKRARTREKLLDVAAELLQAHGISAVSLDQVARAAGFTKGAIYGNFASKDDLVFSVITERTGRALVHFQSATPVREQLRRIARESFGRPSRDRAQFAFLAELDVYALTRPELSTRFVAAANEQHRKSAESLKPFGAELKLAPLEFVLTVQGMVSGLLFQQACFPDVVTEAVALKALEALLD